MGSTETIAFVDIETTGLNKRQHEIIEVAIVIVEETRDAFGNTTIVPTEEYAWKIAPKNLEAADAAALKINQFTPEAWARAQGAEEVLPLVAQALSKVETSLAGEAKNTRAVGGHNVGFDLGFLTHAFTQHGIAFTPNKFVVDTLAMSQELFRDQNMPGFTLKHLCDYFYIENPNAHTALSDVRATAELYKHLLEHVAASEESVFNF